VAASTRALITCTALAASSMLAPMLIAGTQFSGAIPWIEFAFPGIWLLVVAYQIKKGSPHTAWLIAGAPFALFWPVLALSIDYSCRFGGDCL
jgi:hypothetical protein